MLEEKALARLRIEECLDVAEHMYNTKNGEKLSFFNGCSFLWSEEAVAVQYEDMERTFPVEWVPSFVVNASSTSLWTMVVACWGMWQLKSFTSMARQNFCPAAGLVGLNRCGNQLLMRGTCMFPLRAEL